MDMVLLDWTRMGKSYCLAGAVLEPGRVRIVRPLLAKHRSAPVRNVGWSPFLLDGHRRWEVFELIGLEEATPEPPHLEDVWVRALRPRNQSASPDERRAILQATTAITGQPLFGVPLTLRPYSAHLLPGTGQRSLAALIVPSAGIHFSASLREGAGEPDVRAALSIPPLGGRLLPVKDHHLLLRAEGMATNLTALSRTLEQLVRTMGEQVAVRLGLSRGFLSDPVRSAELCWLMIDGFFSLSDPQP